MTKIILWITEHWVTLSSMIIAIGAFIKWWDERKKNKVLEQKGTLEIRKAAIENEDSLIKMYKNDSEYVRSINAEKNATILELSTSNKTLLQKHFDLQTKHDQLLKDYHNLEIELEKAKVNIIRLETLRL